MDSMILSSFGWDGTLETSTFVSASANASSETIVPNAPVLYLVGAVTIGVVGIIANGVLSFLLFYNKKTRKGTCNVLILNQTLIDLVACLLLLVTFATKIPTIYLTGMSGRVYCKLFGSNAMFATGINASTTGLMVITLERYMKIVHSLVYKKRYRAWLQDVALAFPWIYSIVITFPILMAASDVSSGQCLAASYWSASWYQQVYGLATVVWKFLLPLSVFLFCYAKILLLMKAQSRIHAAMSSNIGQILLARSERNIIKTLMFVVGCYVLAYSPFYTYYTMAHLGAGDLTNSTYYLVASISHLNMCINPFIYAIKYQGARVVIQKLGNRCCQRKDKKSSVVPYSIEVQNS